MIEFRLSRTFYSLLITGILAFSGCGPDDFGPPPSSPRPVPVITSLSVIHGPSTGATTVTITGTDFTGATAVLFGATAATTFSVNTDASIVATTPAKSTGTYDVTVTTPSGTSSTATAARFSFTVNVQSAIWPPAQVMTLVTNINGPANVQQTSFTGYVAGPYHYILWPFTVPVTGTYTAISTTTNVLNTTWFLNGLFSPSNVAPTTPLANFIAAVLAANTTPKTGNFTGVSLVAGQQYTVLTAFNTGSVSGDLNTLTITGPGGAGVMPN